jgi:RNA polymerase sigma-70 factor (ECF subfamily)
MAGSTSANRAATTVADLPATEVCDDGALRRRLQAGDPPAFEMLVRQYGGRMLATARRFVRGEQDAADAVQDAFLAAFKAITTFNGDSQLGTWLHRIVVNACLMRRRSIDRHPTVAIESLLPEFDVAGHRRQSVKSFHGSPNDVLATEELRQQVRDCIDRLPAPYREVLTLRDIEEFDTEATAAALGVTPGVVKTRLHRARQALRTLLEPILQQVSA